MLLRVAGPRPYDVFALLDEPLWRVLYVFHHLEEADARDALRARLMRVDAGFMTAHAFANPNALNDEMRSVRAALEALEEAPPERAGDTRDDIAALRARGDALVARITQGGALLPGALVS